MSDFYEGRVFRPPSEASSLIIQSTIGCSHNRCAFCEMYREKRFRVRPVEDVAADLATARGWFRRVDRVFFADGDAFIRPAADQVEIMARVKSIFPECERVSMYASPASILKKSDQDLAAVRAAGVKLLYLGLESGDDAVLKKIDKGATADEIVTACIRARQAGFAVSVTAINGLAGAEGSAAHAQGTAKAVSRMKPDYFSLLTLMLEPGSPMYEDYRAGRYVPLTPRQVLAETREMLLGLDSEGTVFRANHASNYLNLRGTLNADLPRLIAETERALAGNAHIREESWRML